jgi:hypothetical protein
MVFYPKFRSSRFDREFWSILTAPQLKFGDYKPKIIQLRNLGSSNMRMNK